MKILIKRTIICLFIFCVFLLSGCGKDKDVSLFDYTEYDDYVEINSVKDKNLKKINIPNKIKRKPVTVIGDYAFDGCINLTSITIPDSITSIGCDAFKGCINLAFNSMNDVDYLGNEDNLYFVAIRAINKNIETINIQSGCKIIYSSAFFGYTNLANISISDSVTSIGNFAFEGCTNLTSISIPDSITSIGNFAFDECPNITYNLKDNVNYLGNSNNLYLIAISVVDKDVKNISIQSKCKIIYEYAFEECVNLTNIIIPDSVTSICTSAFKRCIGLTSISIPNSVTSIGYGTFIECTNLISMTIPDSLTSISDEAFFGCTNLTSITIPDSVISIGNSAFRRCIGLTSITIPNSVADIGKDAFSGCTNLTINCMATSQPRGWYSVWNPDNCPVIWGYTE